MNTKKKKKQQPFNLRKWLIIASFLLSFGCMVTNESTNCPSDEPEQIQSIGRFKLPPSYDNLYSWCGGLQGWFAEARFDMSPEDLNYFLENLWLTPELSIDGEPRFITFFEDDFDLDAVDSYLYSFTTSGMDLTQELFIDTSNPERYRVYLLILAG